MSLFDGIPLDYEDPKPAAPVKPSIFDRPYLLTIKRASNGQEILLCSVTPPPAKAIAEAAQRGLALFVFDELDAIRKAATADPKAVDIIIESRRVMGYGGPIEYKAAA